MLLDQQKIIVLISVLNNVIDLIFFSLKESKLFLDEKVILQSMLL